MLSKRAINKNISNDNFTEHVKMNKQLELEINLLQNIRKINSLVLYNLN